MVCFKVISTLEGKKERKKDGREGRKEGERLEDKMVGQVRVRERPGQVGGRGAVVAGSRQRTPLGPQEARGPHWEARAGGRWWRLGQGGCEGVRNWSSVSGKF